MTDSNLEIYSNPDVAQHYAAIDYLSPCEQLLFEKYIVPSGNILDLGVGGGRTTPFLSARAGEYLGVDYSPAMVELCRSKFPALIFEVADAANLGRFSDSSFRSIVMSFNGIDYLSERARASCLRECHRLLEPGGVLIFSSHNPRAILVVPRWNRKAVRDMARRATRNNRFAYPIAVAALNVAAALRTGLRAAWSSLVRMSRRIPTRTFWRKEGYLLDPSHGGLMTHYASPERTVSEVERHGFKLCEVRGDDYPARSYGLTTDWYYFVFAKGTAKKPE